MDGFLGTSLRMDQWSGNGRSQIQWPYTDTWFLKSFFFLFLITIVIVFLMILQKILFVKQFGRVCTILCTHYHHHYYYHHNHHDCHCYHHHDNEEAKPFGRVCTISPTHFPSTNIGSSQSKHQHVMMMSPERFWGGLIYWILETANFWVLRGVHYGESLHWFIEEGKTVQILLCSLMWSCEELVMGRLGHTIWAVPTLSQYLDGWEKSVEFSPQL